MFVKRGPNIHQHCIHLKNYALTSRFVFCFVILSQYANEVDLIKVSVKHIVRFLFRPSSLHIADYLVQLDDDANYTIAKFRTHSHHLMVTNNSFQSNDVEDTNCPLHYNDVVMSAMASQIASLTIVYSVVYSGTDQWKHANSRWR